MIGSTTRQRFALVLAATSALLGGCLVEQAPVPPSASELSAPRWYTQLAASPVSSEVLTVGFPGLPGEKSLLYILSLEGGQESQLSPVREAFAFPDWSPDGRKIAIAIGDRIAVAGPIDYKPVVIADGKGAAWSSTEDLLVVYHGPSFGDQSFHRALSIVDVAGNLLREVPIALPAESQLHPPLSSALPTPTPAQLMEMPLEWLQGIAWSPDGTTALISLEASYGAPNAPNVYEVLLVDLATGSSTLFAPGTRVSQVEWSPDGTKIAYVRLVGSFRGKLVITDSAGSCLAEPDMVPEVQDVSWSMDGASILFLLDGRIMQMQVEDAIHGANQAAGCG